MSAGGARCRLEPLAPEEFRRAIGVSRETLGRLKAYAELLRKWQKHLNLVGPEGLRDLWRRHFLDSAQIVPLLPLQTRTLLDLGSGAGFPGMVLAILGIPEVHLVESNRRKCAFLREVARITGTGVALHPTRIEELTPFPVDAITARAVAPLPALLDLVSPFFGLSTCCIFLKGARVEDELAQARKEWSMALECLPSRSDPGGTILRLRRISRDGSRE